ncbi:WD40-repeat-containing domain [Phytophthora cactorum]|nr:WD40-repeat-containing domain [Phytophthora cactorum]
MEDATELGEDATSAEIAQEQNEGAQEVEQEAPDYAISELVRPLSNWEISRDHFVFADMCGLDTGKRHILHLLEPVKVGVHGGVLLTAAGNTVQLLTMSPQVAVSGSSLQSRRYVFGFGGSGIGSLAVHPSRQFFAVGEKGVKPNISIYRYPEITVSHVLRNGTERAYASVEFSRDGETLASVGSGPDFLLTVWKWREEQTVLRCKAFGQDVFSVRFAPTDSGFLATSGVGHIRLWKMAATFTGLKLQGDIGKFGKSELSDIEAFCVLPDKKVLSGTERGVLLLWDGNFIKCEIMTSRRHLPHAGTINVVDFDEDEGHIVTAGKDGYVRFWSFDSIDSADVPADETVALVPMKRQVLVMPQMDIRAVVKQDTGRYLLQDGVGGVHLLLLNNNDEHHIEMDYVPNDTGRATGIVCSPYEHLAATCGEDGSVRAWDYVSGTCLMAVFPELSCVEDQDNGSDYTTLGAATTVAWVPNNAAVINDILPASRQVAVGFDDGLVRILLMDVEHRAWILVNVFKPHSKRVTCVAYSHSGSAFVSASADGTFFLFHVLPSIKSSKFVKYQSEYEPYGFQRAPASVVAICWRYDDEAVLVTLANGQVLEYFVPGELDRHAGRDKQDTERSDTTHATDESMFQAETSAGERESFELHLSSREWALHQRNRFMTVKELEILEAQYPSVIAVGSDGNLSICRVHSERIEGASKLLAGKYESILAEADIARDQAREKQDSVLTMQQKAMEEKGEDDPSNSGGAASTDLSALPAFRGAKAYAAYIENKLSPSVAAARDNEEFLGVIRLASDEKSIDGLPKATPPIRVDGGSNSQTGVPAAALLQLEVEDLANSKEAYTIEDAKLKSEADARARSTLSKQDSTRAVLSTMRTQLQELQAQDAALPLHSRVDPEEWEIDLDYGDLLTRQGDEACDEVRKELAFAVEKEELLLLKMRETYVAIVYRGQGWSNKASISPGYHGEGYPLDEDFPLKEDERRKLMCHNDPAVGGSGAAGWSSGGPSTIPETGGSKSVHGFEARKRLRTERKERLARWQSSKPGEDADDPRDVVAIAFAQRNMGDYKLKTAADYVVPEHQRVNAVKKLRQMALLEESLYAARLRFNAKVLELRELKVQLINELHRDQEQLVELRATLASGGSTPSAVPSRSLVVDLREWPEQRERVSDADIELFLREKKVISHVQTQTGEASLSLTRTGGKHPQSSDRSIAAVARELEGTPGTEAATGITIGHLHLQMDEGTAVATATAATASSPLTGDPNGGNMDEDDVVVHKYLMRQEALLLERKQQREIAAFDAAVAHLRREKLTLEVGFKQAELRLFTLFSELSLLESFESKENLLSSKLEKSKGEKAQIVAELRDVQDLLTSKKHELDEWTRQERAVQAEFLTLVNGGTGSSATPHPSFAALQKLFKRKIKRAKKKPTTGGKEDGKEPDSARDGEEQEEDEEEEEEDDEDYDEDDDDDDEEEEDTCPSGCDLTLYEKVLALREKRADVDDAIGELNKAIEELRKAGERQAAKQRAIDKELAATEQDTQQFQSEKQSRFNQLDVVVPLSTRQLRCLDPPSPNQQNWSLPAQAAGCLVFTTCAFSALTERIESLQAENKQLRQQFRDLHKQQNVLAREKRQQQEAIARAQDRSEQLMRLKFGQLVDLEVLDRACDASSVDELQARVKLREVEGERALRRAKQTHPQHQHAILQATEQNTALLAQIAALTERQTELERELNRHQGSGSGSGDGGGVLSLEDDEALAEREMKERNKLVRLVKLQAREVEALKQEIGLLRGKDGKVNKYFSINYYF